MTHILRGMLARSDFRCCCSRAEVSGRGQDFRNPTPTRTPVVNHSTRQTCRVTDFAAFGARSRSRTVLCTCRIQYRASQTSHRSSPRNVGDLCLRTAQGRNVRGLHCIGGPFRLCRYYYNTTDSAHVSMMSTVEKCNELLCKTVKIAERCIRPYLCQLTKAFRNGSGDRPRV